MRPTKQQRATRARAITLIVRTDAWVIPKSIMELIDQDKFDEAKLAIDRQAKDWPNDPEITRARSLVHFLSGSAAKQAKRGGH